MEACSVESNKTRKHVQQKAIKYGSTFSKKQQNKEACSVEDNKIRILVLQEAIKYGCVFSRK
jgi:CRISPR/Cas system CSM-associated protein Csm4 (group 5 of RAMP superfamily)